MAWTSIASNDENVTMSTVDSLTSKLESTVETVEAHRDLIKQHSASIDRNRNSIIEANTNILSNKATMKANEERIQANRAAIRANRKLAAFGLVAILLFLGAMTGINMFAIETTKESHVKSNVLVASDAELDANGDPIPLSTSPRYAALSHADGLHLAFFLGIHEFTANLFGNVITAIVSTKTILVCPEDDAVLQPYCKDGGLFVLDAYPYTFIAHEIVGADGGKDVRFVYTPELQQAVQSARVTELSGEEGAQHQRRRSLTKSDGSIVSSLLGENVTLGALKNLVTDKPAPITTKLK